MPCAAEKVAEPGPQELQKTGCPQPSMLERRASSGSVEGRAEVMAL